MEERKFVKWGTFKNYSMLLFGTFLMAFAVGNVLEPMQLITGGVSGLGIIIKAYTTGFAGIKTGIPLWITTAVVNTPLFILAFFVKGKKFLGRTFLGVSFLTFFLAVIPKIEMIPHDYFLSTIFGGIIEGVGVGLVLRSMSSTGGSDLLAVVLHEKIPYLSAPFLMAMLDGIVVLIGIFVFGIEKGLYAIVTIFVMTRCSDAVVKGFSYNVAVYVISKKYEEIAKKISEELGRGITLFDASGFYHEEKKQVIFCVINQRQLVYMKELIKLCDLNAFVIVTNTKEIFGEGFKILGNNIQNLSK